MPSHNHPISRRHFLRTAGAAAAGGILLPFTGCSDNPVNGGEKPSPPRVNVDFQLVNSRTGEESPGYVLFEGERVYRSDGRFEFNLEGNQEVVIKSGLSEGSDPMSYVRTTRINPSASPGVVRLDVAHEDFLIANADKTVVGELSRDGYNLEGPIDVTRFVDFMNESFYEAGMTSTIGLRIFGDGNMIRWKNAASGLGPEKVVFADVWNGADGINRSMDEPDFLYDVFSSQFTNVIQPWYSYDIPFERVEHFDFVNRSSVDNIVLVTGSEDITDLANVNAYYSSPDTLRGVLIRMRSPIPDKEILPQNYDRYINKTFIHELGYNGVSGRPTEHATLHETVLQQGRPPELPEALPLLDKKAYEHIHNPRFLAGERGADILGVPQEFAAKAQPR